MSIFEFQIPNFNISTLQFDVKFQMSNLNKIVVYKPGTLSVLHQLPRSPSKDEKSSKAKKSSKTKKSSKAKKFSKAKKSRQD